VYLLAAVSFFVSWALLLGGQTFPMSWLRNPLTDWSLPALARNDITSNAGNFLGLTGWESLIPLVALAAVICLWPPGRLPERAQRSEPMVAAPAES
jgi:hypothetical protein